MAEQQQKYYRVLAPDGLKVRQADGSEKHYLKGHRVGRDALDQVTWLLDDGHIEEAEPPENVHKAERGAVLPAASAPTPPPPGGSAGGTPAPSADPDLDAEEGGG